ncbi:hypothetical protein KY311_03660 [Candidatus Woesearchaeota archaeon]|nr:hypothetical protein [Candidatus Woesearchaeota archaeon]MBW3016982.1 hypothetical protein [Candidatus Woesearchaeota archaeon]
MGTEAMYKKEGDCYVIELKLKSFKQLFNSFDPSPFFEKDLDDEAVDYIVSSAKEFGVNQKIKLSILLPKSQKKTISEQALKVAIYNYFDYSLANTERRLRNNFKKGRLATIVGLIALVISISLADIALKNFSGFLQRILVEGFLIAGWVAMWFPVSVFLYDWWPLAWEKRTYRRLSKIAIDIKYY